MLYCQYCKKRIDEDLVFCPECGEVWLKKVQNRKILSLRGS